MDMEEAAVTRVLGLTIRCVRFAERTANNNSRRNVVFLRRPWTTHVEIDFSIIREVSIEIIKKTRARFLWGIRR